MRKTNNSVARKRLQLSPHRDVIVERLKIRDAYASRYMRDIAVTAVEIKFVRVSSIEKILRVPLVSFQNFVRWKFGKKCRIYLFLLLSFFIYKAQYFAAAHKCTMRSLIFANDYSYMQISITCMCGLSYFRCIFGARIIIQQIASTPLHARNRYVWTAYSFWKSTERLANKLISSLMLITSPNNLLINRDGNSEWTSSRRDHGQTRSACFSICHLHARAVRLWWTRGENLIHHDCSCFQCRQIREASEYLVD